MGVQSNKLVIQNLVVDDVALGVLGARTAISINSQLTAISASFLVKKIKYMLKLSDVENPDEGLMLITPTQGDVTAAEAASAFTEINTAGPSDTTQMLTQDEVWSAWQKAARVMRPLPELADANKHEGWLIEEVSLGKGMVAREGVGVSFQAINITNNAMATGATIGGLIQLWGVWLRD